MDNRKPDIMRFAAYSLISLRVAIACWLGVLAGGCASHGIHMPDRYGPELHGCINHAEQAMGMQWAGRDWTWRLQTGTDDVPSNRSRPFWAIRWGQPGGRQEWRGGWTGGNRSEQNTVIITSPAGELAPGELRTKAVHEAARGIAFSHGIGGPEQDALMKAKGVW